jgi:hypothetical protein
MTQSTRRPGFRLPWSDTSHEASSEQPTAAPDATAEGVKAPTEAASVATGNGSEHATEAGTADGAETAPDGETVVAEIDPTATAPAPAAEATSAAGGAPETDTASETASAASAAAAETAAAAPEVPSPAPASADGDFLASLVTAMRGVVAEERVSSVADLRTAVEDRITQLEARAKERGEELRRRADQDLAGVDEWQKAEIARVTAEAARKVEARRQQLDQQIADHEARSTAEVEGVRGRVTSYEAELEAFFAQLEAIADPAAFVAAARRMPKPPALETDAATPVAMPDATATGSLNARLAELGIDRGAARAADAAATEQPADTSDEAPASPETDAAATAAEQPGHVRDAELAGRLAELDARPEPAAPAATPTPTPPAAATSTDPAEEVATAVMVKGLGSFGAITSFKQRLERLEPVGAVTLSLGPTGEFVYRATHPRDLDLGAAITTLEPGATVEKQPDGALRVTVQPR